MKSARVIEPAQPNARSETARADKARILFVTSDRFPPFRVDVSVLFGQELAGRGYRIDWLMQSERPCDRPYRTQWDGGCVWVGTTDTGETRLARLRKHWRGIRNDLRIVTLVARNEYDFIQVKDKFLSALIAALVARRRSCPFLYWLSFPFPEASLAAAREGIARYPWLYRIRGTIQRFLLYRVILPSADHVFVQSEQMKQDLAREGVPLVKMTPIPMGVAVDTVRPAPATATRLSPAPTLIYLGAMERLRRIDFLVRVLARVRCRVPDAVLYLVGGGDARDMAGIRSEAHRLGLNDAVVITGRVEREQALEKVAAADVCLSPYAPHPVLNSTSPTKLMEYMALGKAVVANDHPEQRQVITESGAGLCVPYNEQRFADAVCELLTDPARRARMGERGRRYVLERRTYGRIADIVENAYGRLTVEQAGEAGGIVR